MKLSFSSVHRILRDELTPEERAQVGRMLAERTVPVDMYYIHDAIAVVLADRRVGELVCHEGEIETV